MHSTIRWLTLKQYVFCKDNRLVLIVECLFVKANLALLLPELELLKLRPLLREQQLICIKAALNQRIWAHTLKVPILTSYKNLSVGYSELKFHIYSSGDIRDYFTSCKKGHNRSPLRYESVFIIIILIKLFSVHLCRVHTAWFSNSSDRRCFHTAWLSGVGMQRYHFFRSDPENSEYRPIPIRYDPSAFFFINVEFLYFCVTLLCVKHNLLDNFILMKNNMEKKNIGAVYTWSLHAFCNINPIAQTTSGGGLGRIPDETGHV